MLLLLLSRFSPIRGPSYLPPIQEALQDQQVGLTQTPNKLLPLHSAFGMCEILHEPFKSRVCFLQLS